MKKKEVTGLKREFTQEYILSNRGCYSEEDVLNIKCIDNHVITLEDLFNELPIKDFTWFLVSKCDLTLDQKKRFALHCAKQVLPIYEKEYPNDNSVRECIEFTEKYVNGECTLQELQEKRDAAYAADAAAAADAYAADAAADAAAAAAAAAAADAYAAAAAAAADAYAADAAAAAAAYAYAAAAAADAYAADAAADAYAADAAADAYAADEYKKSIWEFIKQTL